MYYCDLLLVKILYTAAVRCGSGRWPLRSARAILVPADDQVSGSDIPGTKEHSRAPLGVPAHGGGQVAEIRLWSRKLQIRVRWLLFCSAAR